MKLATTWQQQIDSWMKYASNPCKYSPSQLACGSRLEEAPTRGLFSWVHLTRRTRHQLHSNASSSSSPTSTSDPSVMHVRISNCRHSEQNEDVGVEFK